MIGSMLLLDFPDRDRARCLARAGPVRDRRGLARDRGHPFRTAVGAWQPSPGLSSAPMTRRSVGILGLGFVRWRIGNSGDSGGPASRRRPPHLRRLPEAPELLSLQQLLSDPPVHDELLFIVVHQAYELWFKQILFELESVRDRLFAGDTERARHYLKRVHAIERVLIEHIEVLETMSPAGLPRVPRPPRPGLRIPVGPVP